MEELDIDLVAMPEANTPWAKELITQLRMHGNRCFKSFKCVGTSSNKPSVSKYQPGGVGIFTCNNVVGRINKVDDDARGLGRWCYMHLNGQFKKNWWIVAVYRV
eukprot:794920-Ditylum_brightwellii.AAC.1